AELVELKKDYTFEIMVDGAIAPEKISKLSQLGVKGFVLGTSALFGKKESYAEIIKKLKQEKMEELR
ncbi:ribulose phosphate epimerase, partial [Escherichia coli]|nr:ribulose phosphate epimerase [Escherichia coli]